MESKYKVYGLWEVFQLCWMLIYYWTFANYIQNIKDLKIKTRSYQSEKNVITELNSVSAN